MRIAIFGWGSLIHSPDDLAYDKKWRTDGPTLPIEFSRISGIKENRRRLTLVIVEGAQPVQTLYTESTLTTLEEAVENLRLREKTPDHLIGYIDFNSEFAHIARMYDLIKPTLIEWNKNKGYDAAIWTDIGPNLSTVMNSLPTMLAIETFFKSLNARELDEAKQYILKTHPQIQTKNRKQIEDIISKV